MQQYVPELQVAQDFYQSLRYKNVYSDNDNKLRGIKTTEGQENTQVGRRAQYP